MVSNDSSQATLYNTNLDVAVKTVAFNGMKWEVKSVAISADGSTILTATKEFRGMGFDEKFDVWTVDTASRVSVVPKFLGRSRLVGNGKLFAEWRDDEGYIYDLSKTPVVAQGVGVLLGQTESQRAPDLLNRVLSVSPAGNVEIRSGDGLEKIWTLSGKNAPALLTAYVASANAVLSSGAYLPEEKRVLYDTEVAIWDSAGKELRRLRCPTKLGSVRQALAVSKSPLAVPSNVVARVESATGASTCVLWDWETGKIVPGKQFPGPEVGKGESVISLSYIADRSELILHTSERKTSAQKLYLWKPLSEPTPNLLFEQ